MKIRDDIMLYGKLAHRELGYVAGQVEVTSECFQHCMHCSSWRDKSCVCEMSLEQLKLIVEEAGDMETFEHLTLTGGDPQAWPHLDKFLEWWEHQGFLRYINLQVSTALARDIEEPKLWRTAIKDLRVSIDAYSDFLYSIMRGDKENNFGTILKRLEELKHPNLAIIVTAYLDNIIELLPLLTLLDNLYRKGLHIRRIIVMIGISVKLNEAFRLCWRSTKKWAEDNTRVPTSFADDILAVRAMCKSSVVDDVRCWASRLGFHIKPNGDVYPCCLVGGEAVEVQKEFCMGNVFEQDLADIYNSYTPTIYGVKPICKEICQFKQLQINLAGELATKTKLAIP